MPVDLVVSSSRDRQSVRSVWKQSSCHSCGRHWCQRGHIAAVRFRHRFPVNDRSETSIASTSEQIAKFKSDEDKAIADYTKEADNCYINFKYTYDFNSPNLGPRPTGIPYSEKIDDEFYGLFDLKLVREDGEIISFRASRIGAIVRGEGSRIPPQSDRLGPACLARIQPAACESSELIEAVIRLPHSIAALTRMPNSYSGIRIYFQVAESERINQQNALVVADADDFLFMFYICVGVLLVTLLKRPLKLLAEAGPTEIEIGE